MTVKDLVEKSFDNVVVYRSSTENDYGESYEDLYKGNAKKVPKEIMALNVSSFGAKRKGVLDIKVETCSSSIPSKIKIGNKGIKLIIKYRDTLKVSTSEAVEILLRNKTVKLLLSQEKMLESTDEEYNLELILSATLVREKSNKNRLVEDEKQLLESLYKFKIGNGNLDDPMIELEIDENKKVARYIERFMGMVM